MLVALRAAGPAAAAAADAASPAPASTPAPAPVAEPGEPPERPNLVMILADDVGWADVGYHGSPIRTPRVDQLAAQGVRLESFYVLQECTPTRAALMTGRHPIRYGLQEGVFWPWSKEGLPADERTLAEALHDAGYATAIVGKWHLGHHALAQLPLARGFDHQYGMYTGVIDHFEHRYFQGLDWHRDDRALEEKGWATTLMGREAARLVDGYDFSARPLFLYFAPFAPHAPPQPPPEYADAYDGVFQDPMRRKYAAMVTGMDDAVGMLLDALERRGVMDRTLIFFVSDNGGAIGVGGRNDPLRGEKSQLWEGGVRVPAVAYWRGVLPAGTEVQTPLHVTDLYPTLLRRAGAPLEQAKPLDGIDAWPAIARGEPLPRQEILINIQPRQSALRVGDWKIVRSYEADGLHVELFDLAKDPNEHRDLSRLNRDKLAELSDRLLAWQKQAVPPLGPYPQYLPAGYAVPRVWGDPASPPAPIGGARPAPSE